MKSPVDETIKQMSSMLAEVEKLLPSIVWKAEPGGAFTGTDPDEKWALTVTDCDGVAVHEPSGTILHLTPDLSRAALALARA